MMLKQFLTAGAVLCFAGLLSAQTPAAAESAKPADKVLYATYGNAEQVRDNRFERMDPSDTEDLIRPTSVAVRCTPRNLEFDIMFMMEDGSPIASRTGVMELFFEPHDRPEGKRRQEYYQFYGPIRRALPFPIELKDTLALLGLPWYPNMEIMPYYYTHTHEKFPYLRDYSVEVGFVANSASIHVVIPWSELAAVLPFDENGKGRTWRFSLMRGVGDVYFTWQGRPHRPESWGLLKFPDITVEQVKTIYRNAALRNCEKTWTEFWRFAPESLWKGIKALQEDLQKRRLTVPVFTDKLSVQEWAALAESIRKEASGKKFIVAAPKPMMMEASPEWKIVSNTDNAIVYQYTFKEPISNAWLLNCSLYDHKGDIYDLCTVAVDDRIMPKPNPRHWNFGAAYKDSTLTVSVRKTDKKLPHRMRMNFTVETFGRDFLPVAPAEPYGAAPLENAPIFSPDGTIYAPALSRHLPQCVRMLGDRTSVVWLGDSKMDALGFTEAYKKFASTIPSAECGVVADTPRRVLWRVEYGVYGLLKPSYIVLNFAGRRQVTEDAATIIKIIDMLHKQTPETKILILSALPDRQHKHYSDNLDFIKLNRELKKAADERKKFVAYLDVTDGFYKVDGTLNMEMFHKSKSCFADQVYQTWCDTVEEVILRNLRNNKK